MVKLTTLSKAISITPRKTIFNLRLLILLVFLLTLCPLGAESWRYSVIGENQEYVSLVESTLSLIPYADGEEAISKVVERVERSKRIEEDKKKAQYYEDENYNALSSFSYSSLPPVDVVQLEKVSLSLSQYDSLLSDGDKDTYEYLMIQNNLDALFYVRSKGEGTIKEIELLYNGDVIRKAYYTTSLYSFEEEALLDYFSSLLSPHLSYYVLNVDVPSYSLVLDGEVNTDPSDFLVLEKGIHTFTLSSPGYVEKTEVLEIGEEREINLSLEPLSSHSLYVSVHPWDAGILLNGEKVDEKYIPSLHSPYTLSLSSPDFSHFTFQSKSNEERVEIEMNPLWTEDKDIVMEKKNSFYRSILTSLLSFGGYTAVNAVENINGTSGPNALKVVFGGISIVSLINLVYTALDYYGSASQGV